ncbi:MAG TPA: c-type cytochrome [Candidatus Acidoferrales bacterium]|nr:c-type cytochrome [Candidatus Acidoferrales bacterium]
MGSFLRNRWLRPQAQEPPPLRPLLISALLLFASLAAGAGAAHDWKRDRRGVLLAIARAPVKARARKNPYEGRADAVAAGKKLYRRHCAECHGGDALGTATVANLRMADVQGATSGELEWFLRNGNLANGMPSWSGLPEQRRWQIVSYIKSLGAR